ncbi:MAG: GIY-YIG nuclease family protein [Cyanobacteria bacterium]|nr:GIY-YIG nuclease family protein [Cyanobacteriota bacterium]MDA1246380.1 GIY-YIG nuclease family protein [Cyanobacteriota bacterium]
MTRQGELFANGHLGSSARANAVDLPLQASQLLEWQSRLSAHQQPLWSNQAGGPMQVSLFASSPETPDEIAEAFNPLQLTPQALSFWRWPSAPQQGAALYLVTDRPAGLAQPLLLYVGETGQADRRWKGEHDCKAYLAAYSEALLKAGLVCHTSIRFWLDVPAAIQPRRALEQALIQRWRPPFNKETRSRWATPFQTDPA